MYDFLSTLLDLADTTSRNLQYAYDPEVHVSFGEETITEINLLELQRRHPQAVQLKTFSRRAEATNGADWEWHIIGRHWVLKLMVQAKRLAANNVLKIKYTVRSTGADQLDTLIAASAAANCRPIYCLYCTEAQRRAWAIENRQHDDQQEYSQYGCLICDANDVRGISPKSLQEIEDKCVPWHYLALNKHASYNAVKNWDQFGIRQLQDIVFLASFQPDLIIQSGLGTPNVPQLPTFESLNKEELVDSVGLVRRREYNLKQETIRMEDTGSSTLVTTFLEELGVQLT
ncbi:MAG: DUF6615 family protein [Pseudomonadota bacterium]